MYRSLIILGFATVAALGGCGTSAQGPETAAVSGIVFINGVPASDLQISFMNGAYTVFSTTDSHGKYELPVGAAVGENKVFFSKIVAPRLDLSMTEGIDEGQLMAMSDPGVPKTFAPKQLIPDTYSDPTKTTISFVVPSGGAVGANFELTTR